MGLAKGIGHAGRTARRRHPLHIEEQQNRLTLDVGETDIQRVGQTLLAMTINLNLWNARQNTLFQTVTQGANTAFLNGQIRYCQFTSNAQTNNTWHVVSTGAPIALLMAAMKQRCQTHAFAYIESTNTLRSSEFMTGDSQQIDPCGHHIDGHPTHRLHCIGMKAHFMFTSNGPNFSDRKQGTCFVVAPHSRNENGPLANGRFQLSQIDHAFAIDVQQSDLEALLLKILTVIKHRRMLNSRSDNVVTLVPQKLRAALDGQGITLTAARGKDDLLRLAVDQCRDLSPRPFNGAAHGLTGPVNAGRIAELFLIKGQHRLQHCRTHRGGGIVIHVDPFHCSSSK